LIRRKEHEATFRRISIIHDDHRRFDFGSGSAVKGYYWFFGNNSSADNLYVDVDLSGGSAYLPPGGSKVWFLKVSDQAYGDTGTIRTFRITYQGQTFSSTDPPVSVRDNQTSYTYTR